MAPHLWLLAASSGGVDLPAWAAWGIGGVLFGLIATGTLIVPAYWWRMERKDRQAAEERERETYRDSTHKLLAGIDTLAEAQATFKEATDRMLALIDRVLPRP